MKSEGTYWALGYLALGLVTGRYAPDKALVICFVMIALGFVVTVVWDFLER